MTQFVLKSKSFKKMDDPTQKNEGRVKYVCYVQCSSIPEEMLKWMGTNPRDQKMSTNVAKSITESLYENINFHELNRGIVVSADNMSYDNKTELATMTFTDPDIHGNIDGGHTLRAIIETKNKTQLSDDRYVFFEIFTGLKTTVDLAEARNTAVQVDLKSIEELKSSFETIKSILQGLPFENSVQYKMNEPNKTIDIREVLALIIMFSKDIYPVKNSSGFIMDNHPVQCYSGKEASLRKFLNTGNKDQMLLSMQPIISDIFKLWNTIEREFAEKGFKANKRYGARKYSKFNDNKIIEDKTKFYGEDLYYYVPKGIIYPLIGAFRALVDIYADNYRWVKNPFTVWNDIGHKLVGIVLDEQAESPDILAKNSNLWSNLFKEVFIYAYLQNNTDSAKSN